MKDLLLLLSLFFISSIANAQQKEAKPSKIKTINDPEMILVQGGSFNMGSNEGENDELPIHKVTLSSFKIGKYEVTQAQWIAIMVTNPSKYNSCGTCPVENVSWLNVQEYLKKLNKKTGKKYRLPTEAEWEFAAHGGNKSHGYTYSGSDTVEEVSWYKDNSGGTTNPCGGKKPNELGLYDMNGNVWEWCRDWYNETYYGKSPGVNPQGSASGILRALRGGSWYFDSGVNRLSFRYYDKLEYKSDYVGFRLAISQ